MDKLRVTVLCDNLSDGELRCEHGFSLLLERGGSSLLMDVGDSGAFADNAAALGKDLSSLDAVLLSHDHYDHTGGLARLLEIKPDARVYLSAHFFKQSGWRRADRPGVLYPTSGPLTAAGMREAGARFLYIEDPVYELREFPGAFALGAIPRSVPFETQDDSDVAYRSGEWVSDDYRDELALAVRTGRGLVVATGCAHRGVCSIISCARERLGGDVAGVIGGTHLMAFGAERAAATAGWLRREGVPRLVACHCTGDAGFEALSAEGYEKGRCGFCCEF